VPETNADDLLAHLLETFQAFEDVSPATDDVTIAIAQYQGRQ
jgi:hypothetical protein